MFSGTAPTHDGGPWRARLAGLMTGLLTLAVGAVILSLSGIGLGQAAADADVEVGDCLSSVGTRLADLEPVDCAAGHRGQVTAIITHPDAGRSYPGDGVTAVWFEESCRQETDEFLGTDALATIFTSGLSAPTEAEWDGGTDRAVCWVSVPVGVADVSGSLEGRGDEWPRGDEVTIGRLMSGDCFEPIGEMAAFDLRSSDTVRLVPCDSLFSGMFFGRGRLAYPADAAMPNANEMTEASTAACAERFEAFFGVPSADGFTFRFWRPSQSSWEGGNREVLCAVLSEEPVLGPYVPADYPALYALGIGQCFVLLPEQTALTVLIDDHVRPVRCTERHVGQLIGGGQFETEGPFPGLNGIQTMATSECRRLFEGFVGVPPAESVHGRFPYWFPDEEAWTEGDGRYACAILGDTVLTESLQGSET